MNDMESKLNLGSIELPLSAVTKTFAILAKKGAGKSYTAGVMMEEMISAGLPIVVFDPIDIYWGLRIFPINKQQNDEMPLHAITGFNIVVFGVLDNVDIVIDETMGERIARFIVEKNVSCVISTFGMSKKAQRKLITDFSETLIKINNTPRHVFIEEAHEFVPQRVGPDMGRCFSAVESLVVMGRNRGLGVTLINQRAATINKDVLTQIDTLLAFRNVAPQDRKALKEWVEIHSTDDDFDAFWKSLPTLPTGTGWIWSPEWLDKFEQITIRERKTLHPNREKVPQDMMLPEIEQQDIKTFIDEFNNGGVFVEPEKSKWKESGKKKIKTPKGIKKSSEGIVKDRLENEPTYKRFEEENKSKDIKIKELTEKLEKAQGKLDSIYLILKGKPLEVSMELKEVSIIPETIGDYGIQSANINMWVAKLPKGAGRILQLLFDKRPLKYSRSQLALLTGIRLNTLVHNGSYLPTLKKNNLVIEENGNVVINPDLL